MTYLVAIGTKKGLFLARSADRRDWTLTGPVRLGDDASTPQSAVYAVGIDTRAAVPRLFVGSDSSHFGPSVWHSDDLGENWTEPSDIAPIALPGDGQESFARVWQFAFGPEPEVVYASGEPHSLFRSDDRGVTFRLDQGLWDHPHRGEWFPGFGGAAIHTVLPHPSDPDIVTVAMSTGGVYRTTDGGRTWNPANRGIRVDFQPDQYPEFGQCVHKVAQGAGDPDRFYAQNHGGVYRTDDAASTWTSIASELPYDFGFAMVAHPRLSDTVLDFPVRTDGNRFLPDDRLTVQRTDDAGASWFSMNDGLPDEPYFGIVLRDAATTDADEVPGFYFGTRCGDVFATTEDSRRWVSVASHLPDVLCVRAARV